MVKSIVNLQLLPQQLQLQPDVRQRRKIEERQSWSQGQDPIKPSWTALPSWTNPPIHPQGQLSKRNLSHFLNGYVALLFEEMLNMEYFVNILI